MSLHQAIGTRLVDQYAQETMGAHDFGAMDGHTAQRVARRRLAEVEARRNDPRRPPHAFLAGGLLAVLAVVAWRLKHTSDGAAPRSTGPPTSSSL